MPSGQGFGILGVDAATVADAAFWDASFADESLDELASRLVPETQVRCPSCWCRAAGAHGDPNSRRSSSLVEVVGRADAFPGVSSDDPIVVVDAATLEERVGVGNPFFSANARTEYWIKGDTQEAVAAVSELEAYPLDTVDAREVQGRPFIKAAIDTFSMLNVLGLGAALLVVGVLVVYLQARQRARAVSNVLSCGWGCGSGRRGSRSDSSSGRSSSRRSSSAPPSACGRTYSSRRCSTRCRRSRLRRCSRALVVLVWTVLALAAVAGSARGSCSGGRRRSTWGRCSALPNEPVPARCVDLVKTYRTPTGAVTRSAG